MMQKLRITHLLTSQHGDSSSKIILLKLLIIFFCTIFRSLDTINLIYIVVSYFHSNPKYKSRFIFYNFIFWISFLAILDSGKHY